jgi:outer membrane protein OmpA-like peptidoglycan-associated protein
MYRRLPQRPLLVHASRRSVVREFMREHRTYEREHDEPEPRIGPQTTDAPAVIPPRMPAEMPGRGGGRMLVAMALRVQATTGNRALQEALRPPAANGDRSSRIVSMATGDRALQPTQTTTGSRTVQRVLMPTTKTGRRVLQRQLIATGEVDRFIAMVEPAIGVVLSHDPATNAVTAVGSLATPATSPALATILTNIMNDAGQDAEVHFGRGQPLVSVGAFPDPDDMTGSRVQLIDIDDVENLEAGAPGHGLAKFAHEIQENYTAHSQIPTTGVDLFPVAHAEGVRAESAVASELVAGGADRVAARSAPGASANETIEVQDFTVHFLVWTQTRTGQDFAVSNARTAGRTPVSTHTIDNFATGSSAMPAGGAAPAAAAQSDLAAHPQATARIEGFTDNVGTSAVNDPLSAARAATVRAAVVGGGIGGGSLHSVGRGATNFVANNASEAGRGQNRRVVITIEEPSPP